MNACPDCNADTRLLQIEPNVYVYAIEHDDTCPMLRAMEKTR
ncbi:hypothetical protein [Microbacterium sp.]